MGQRDADGEELVALAAAYQKMTPVGRVCEARRSDPTENEQLALAAFADDPEVASALLDNPGLSDAPEGLARSMRRQSRPWWRRPFGFG